MIILGSLILGKYRVGAGTSFEGDMLEVISRYATKRCRAYGLEFKGLYFEL